jgi:uncharacterized protein CbrC (UPF0167 family)
LFFCGTTSSPVTKIEPNLTIISSETIEEGHNVCLSCLRDKKYGFEYEVEHAFLNKEGIILDDQSYAKNSDYYISEILPVQQQLLAMKRSKQLELMHTPPFRAWQGSKWLVHCNDFMKYIGVWSHEDFVHHAPNGNAEDFYGQIYLYCGDGLYESAFGPNKSEYAECTFYAFECLTCNEKRGYIDNA